MLVAFCENLCYSSIMWEILVFFYEGRCALATSFSTWKFIIAFGQAYVFAKTGSIYFDVIMPFISYLVIDVVVLIAVSFEMTLSEPLAKLGLERQRLHY